MGSKILTNKISSSLTVKTERIATAAADTPIVSSWMSLPAAYDFLVQLTKAGGNAGILTGFSIEATGDDVLDGVGDPIADGALDIVTIKERLELDCPTPLDGSQITGDAGADGNVYLLEAGQQEFGFEAAKSKFTTPRFYRVSVMTTGDTADFDLAIIATGLEYADLPVISEVIA